VCRTKEAENTFARFRMSVLLDDTFDQNTKLFRMDKLKEFWARSQERFKNTHALPSSPLHLSSILLTRLRSTVLFGNRCVYC